MISFVELVDFAIMAELYLIYSKALVRKSILKNDLDVPTLLILLLFSWLLPMSKSTLFLSFMRVPYSRTLLIKIWCSCSVNETFSAIVEFHMKTDVSCYDIFGESNLVLLQQGQTHAT